jgi:hypothetical protein
MKAKLAKTREDHPQRVVPPSQARIRARELTSHRKYKSEMFQAPLFRNVGNEYYSK